MGSLFFKSSNLTFIKYKNTKQISHLHSVEIINSPIVSYLKRKERKLQEKERGKAKF